MKAFWMRVAAIFGLALIASAATFRPATLLVDLNTVPVPSSSHPSVVCDAPGWTLILSQVPNASYKLWRSDGTTAGTVQIQEFATTQSSSTFTCLYSDDPAMVYFQYTDDSGQGGLWRSDGTRTGTFQLLATQPTFYEMRLLGVQGLPLFVAQLNDATGLEVIRTDGTIAGTTLLKDFTPGPDGSYFAPVAVTFNGQLYFDVNGSLWATDGTTAGTRGVINNPNAQSFLTDTTVAVVGNRVLLAYINGNEETELWSSDGTTAGSTLLSTFHVDGGSAYVQNMTTVNASRVIFSAPLAGEYTDPVWRTDGTVAGTQLLLSSQAERLYSGRLASRVGDGVVFLSGTTANGIEPWFTNGTDAGTRLLHDHSPGPADTYIYPVQAIAGGVVYSVNFSPETWFTDGTPGGTWSLSGLNAQYDADVGGYGMSSSGSDILIWSQDRAGSTPQNPDFRHTLWRVSTTNRSITRVTDITPHSFNYAHELRAGRMLVGLDTGTSGIEPWITDGTPNGLRLLRDLEPETLNGSSEPAFQFRIGGKPLFTANDGRNGDGLWITDGSAVGTQRLSSGAAVYRMQGPASMDMGAFTLYAGKTTAGAAELWRTDGTVAGTTLVRDLSTRGFPADTLLESNPGSCGMGFAGGNGLAYYGATQARVGKLFRSDGTAAGTIEIGAFPNNGRGFLPTSRVCVLGLHAGFVYFEAMDPQTSEILLWRSAGQAGSYERVLTEGGAVVRAPLNMVEMSGALWFFTFAQNDWALWKITPGTAVARMVLPRTWTTSPSYPTMIGTLGNALLFRDVEVDAGGFYISKLYRTDGTGAGTFALATTAGGSSFPSQFGARIGARFLFPGVGDATGINLWISDGSTAGTTALRIPVFGDQTSPYTEFIDFNGLTYFIINRAASGSSTTEIWRTDGTTSGTERVNSVPAMPLYLPQMHFAVTGHRLLLTGTSDTTGNELWSIENEAPVAQADSASTTSPAAVTIDVLANDADPDGTVARASLRIAGTPTSGTVTADAATGTVRYVPDAAFSGSDSFRYIVADTQGRDSAPATVTVTVAAAPGGGGSGGGGGGSGGGGSGGGGGGGGSFDWLALASLLLLGARRVADRLRVIPTRPCASRSAGCG